jgi:hypothetical protein
MEKLVHVHIEKLHCCIPAGINLITLDEK